MSKDVFALPTIYYDWDKGMDRNATGILIWIDGVYTQVNNVKFYDTVRGFVQTDKAIYMPLNLKDKSIAD